MTSNEQLFLHNPYEYSVVQLLENSIKTNTAFVLFFYPWLMLVFFSLYLSGI